MQPAPADASVDEDAEDLADSEGLSDIAAGRLISGEAVKRWLSSWGTPGQLPPPKVGD